MANTKVNRAMITGLTKADVGLGNVDNTADADKPVATSVSNALALKAPIASPTFTGTVSGVTKAMVGLGSVDNTADTAKPVSTAQQAALDLKAPLASPTFTGTVSGITKAMVGLGSVDNTSDAAKPISSATQTALDAKAPINNPTFTGTVGGISKAMVGLGSVDNTSDASKPVSTATQTALNGKVSSVVAGTNVTVDNTDPRNPVISATGGGGGGSGDVAGPASSVNNRIAVFNGTTGKLLSDGGSTISQLATSTQGAKADAAVVGAGAVTSGNPVVFSGTSGQGIAQTTFASFKTSLVLVKADVGLGNVDNTSDANKPVSTATQTALNLKANSSSPTLSNPTINDGYTEETEVANSGTAFTFDLANGTIKVITLTGNVVYTAPTAVAGKSFRHIQKQDGTGNRTATWPASFKWPGGVAPVLTATASKADIFDFTCDGTNWYGTVAGKAY